MSCDSATDDSAIPLVRRESLDLDLELLSGREAFVAIDRQRLGHDRLECFGVILEDLRRRLELAVDHPIDQRELPGRVEAALPGGELVHDRPEREHVGAAIDVLAPHLLGSHVRQLALDRSSSRDAGQLGRRRNAEVRQLDLAVVAHQHVGRRHVAVHQPERATVRAAALVGVVQRRRHSTHDREGTRQSHAAHLRGRALDLMHALAVHVLHREKVLAAVAAEVDDVHDVRVVEPRSQPRLVEEHLQERLVARQVGQHALDRHDLLVARDFGMSPDVQLRHSAHRELADDLIATELGAGLERAGALGSRRVHPRTSGAANDAINVWN